MIHLEPMQWIHSDQEVRKKAIAKAHQAAGNKALKTGAQQSIKENEKKKDSTKIDGVDTDLSEKRTFCLGHAELGTLAGYGGEVFRQQLDVQV